MSAYLEPLEPGPRCRKWNLVVSAGSGASRRRKSRTFHGTKREALEALKAYEREVDVAPVPSSAFGDWARDWNDARLGSGAVSSGTHEKYLHHINVLSRYLPNDPTEITPLDIQRAYASMRKERGLTGTTLSSMHGSLSRIFRAMEAEGIVKRSPMTEVDAPKPDTAAKRSLTPEQAQTLIGALSVEDNRSFAVSLALRCGLRRGELLGLMWSDISENQIQVPRGVTKSAAGARTVPMGRDCRKFVEKRRALVSEHLEKMGDKLRPEDALCCGLDGRPLTAASLRKWWERHRGEYGLDGWTIHELRHTYLTNLAQAGAHPAVMQRLAGHSSMRTTMGIYTHVNDADLTAAVDEMDGLREQSARKPARSSRRKENRPDDSSV